jgi:hypothetical protein
MNPFYQRSSSRWAALMRHRVAFLPEKSQLAASIQVMAIVILRDPAQSNCVT